MLALIGRRLATLVPVLIILSVAVFSLVSLIPGNAAQTLAGQSGTPAEIALYTRQLHLDEPFWVQYWHWAAGAIHLDFGKSLLTGQPVSSALLQRMPVTLELVMSAAVVAVAIGVPAGILAGLQPGGKFDRASRMFASGAAAVPAFWLGPLLLLAFAVERQWLPSSGFTSVTGSPIAFARHALLPAITLGLFVAASLMRQLRSALIDSLDSNYVRTMWAKGARPRLVVVKHALRNAAAPALTVFGLQIGFLLGGSVIIEQIFGLQGVGSYVLGALTGRDVPVIQGVAMVFALCTITISLLVDIAYALLNPRVRVT